MTTEEKARAYDEALERARAWYNETEPDSYSCIVENIFPELAESKDERIKNRLIKLIKMSSEVGGFALHKWEADEMLAWIEKQGEQKHTFRERYENIAKSEWFKRTHDGISVSDDEESKRINEDEVIRKSLMDFFDNANKVGENPMCEYGIHTDKILAWLKSLK